MWLFLILVGFVGFILSLFGAIWRGFDSTGAARPILAAWLIGAALFFLLWMIALPRYPVPWP
jgi:O-antigen/teichoic acid export membrane protein